MSAVGAVDGCHFFASLFCAAGVLHDSPGRMHVAVGLAGSIVSPARSICSAPQAFVLLRVTLVTVLVPARLMVSMSMTALPPPTVVWAVPLQTWAAAGSLMVLTVKPAPVRHSRMLPPTVRSVLCVVPSLKVTVTLPTTLPSYHQLVFAELSSRNAPEAFNHEPVKVALCPPA